MKINQNIAKALAIVGASAALAGTAAAGEYMPMTTKGPIAPPPPLPPIDDTLGFTLAAGYDTDYIFRGVDYGQHLVWTALDYGTEFGDVDFSAGAWYASLADDDYTELDLYAGLGYDLGPVDLSAGYIWYYFPRSDEDTHEIYGAVGSEFGGVGVEFYAGYDTGADGWYLAGSAGYSVELTDAIALDFSAGVSYSIEYYTPDNGWNNVDLRLALPIALTSTATLEPYIAGSIALDELENTGEDDHVYGGVSLAVDF